MPSSHAQRASPNTPAHAPRHAARTRGRQPHQDAATQVRPGKTRAPQCACVRTRTLHKCTRTHTTHAHAAHAHTHATHAHTHATHAHNAHAVHTCTHMCTCTRRTQYTQTMCTCTCARAHTHVAYTAHAGHTFAKTKRKLISLGTHIPEVQELRPAL